MAALPAVKSGSAGAITWGESLLPPAAWASGADRTARPRNAAESRRKPGRKAVMVGILDTLRSIPARTMGPPPAARPPQRPGDKAVGPGPVGGPGQAGAGLYTLHAYLVPPNLVRRPLRHLPVLTQEALNPICPEERVVGQEWAR